MSKNIVFEGWLTKSPPTKRIWRAKWRRRWFALRHSGDLPGQYFLDYYADRTRRRPKGTIDLDLCEQVDAGLHMERGNALDPRLRGLVFTVRTHHRTYHLEADSEVDMAKWVEAICRACGLRSTEDANEGIATYQNSPQPLNQYERVDSNGVYIPISECITGVRVQDQRAFTFDPKSIMARQSRDAAAAAGRHSKSQPQIRVTNVEFSENDDDVSDDDCKSLNASQSNIEDDWSVAQTFTKLAVDGKGKEVGPPVPPRPPKPFQGPKMSEPEESDYISVQTGAVSLGAVPKRPSTVRRARSPTSNDEENHTVYISQGAIPKRPPQTATHHAQAEINENDPDPRKNDEERKSSLTEVKNNFPPPAKFNFDESIIASLQYCNLSDEVASNMAVASILASQPPVVDRALKPRYGRVANCIVHQGLTKPPEVRKSDVLHYLDLDLPNRTPVHRSYAKNRASDYNGQPSESESNYNYKTVDFLKTEAFNMTRQDAEAFRNIQC